MTFMRRFVASACTAATVLLSSPATNAQQQQPLTLVVSAPATTDTGPLLYAMQSGLFTKAGLNVNFVQLANGAAISAAIIGGSVQVGLASLPALIAAHTRGVPFQMLTPAAVYTSSDPYGMMFVRKDAPIRSAADLKGKVLASPALKDLDWVANSSWIDRNGGDSRSSQSVELPNPALLPALLDGRVDAYTIGQPWATVAMDSGKVRVLGKSFDAIAPRFLMDAYISTTDIINSNREAIERFDRVMLVATRYANSHKAEIVPLVAALTKLDPAQVARTMKGGEGEYLEPNEIAPLIGASVHYGIIEKPFDPNELISPLALKRPK